MGSMVQNHDISPGNPLYLHPNENPTLILVQPLLNNKNYHPWSHSMKMALITKNKLGFIDGTIDVPAVNSPDFQVWLQCNTFVKTWILNSVIPTIAQSVMYKETARQIWLDLQSRFSRLDVFRLGDLLEQVNALKQGDSDVTSYFTRLKTLWDEISMMKPDPVCSCNPRCHCDVIKIFSGYAETERVVKFLRGLNSEFSHVLTQAQLMVPVPDLDTVFAMALKLEDQRDSDSKFPENTSLYNRAFSTNPTSGAQIHTQHSSYQQSSGRISNNPGSNFKKNSGNMVGKKVQCTFCGYTGHTVDKCYKKHGFPPGWKPKSRVNLTEVQSEDQLGNSSDHMSTQQSSESYTLNKDQFQQLMKLLDVQKSNPYDHMAN